MSLNKELPDSVAEKAQYILNTILRTFDIPFLDRNSGDTIRFGAFEHKENKLSLRSGDTTLSLDLRDPERLLDVNFWHSAHNYESMSNEQKEAFSSYWNKKARVSLQCAHVKVTGYESSTNNIQLNFDLTQCDNNMLRAIEMVLVLTHLDIKDTPRPEVNLH